MLNQKLILFLLLTLTLGGCGSLQGVKLMAPENAGFSKVTANLYVESGANEAERAALIDALAQAENAVRSAYGNIASQPVVHACISEACFQDFHGGGSRALVYFGHLVLLSPRGLNWHYIAHEWSHAEMFARLTLPAWWWRLPQWFDEGLAVTISEAPENAESHWAFLVETGVPLPKREELVTFRTLGEWDAAVGRFGEKGNLARKARGEPEIRPVYTAAGHEVRPWLAKVGHTGLLRVIKQLNEGNAFESVYQPAD